MINIGAAQRAELESRISRLIEFHDSLSDGAERITVGKRIRQAALKYKDLTGHFYSRSIPGFMSRR